VGERGRGEGRREARTWGGEASQGEGPPKVSNACNRQVLSTGFHQQGWNEAQWIESHTQLQVRALTPKRTPTHARAPMLRPHPSPAPPVWA